MTPHQGDSPNQPRGRQPSGNEYQQPPTQQPQQPPTGGFQGQPVQGGQQGQPQPMRQYQGSMPQGRAPQGQIPQGPPQQQAGGASPGAPPQAPQTSPNTGMQPQGTAQPGGPGARSQRGSQLRMRPIRIEEIIEDDVVTAQRDTPIATVVAKMAEEDVGSVVVVENDQPVGILTDRKIALALENTPDVANKQAGELISGDLVTATTSMSIFDALRQLSDEGIRRLPIVDDNGALQGIITLDDILVLLGSELNKAGETIRAQSPRL